MEGSTAAANRSECRIRHTSPFRSVVHNGQGVFAGAQACHACTCRFLSLGSSGHFQTESLYWTRNRTGVFNRTRICIESPLLCSSFVNTDWDWAIYVLCTRGNCVRVLLVVS